MVVTSLVVHVDLGPSSCLCITLFSHSASSGLGDREKEIGTLLLAEALQMQGENAVHRVPAGT